MTEMSLPHLSYLMKKNTTYKSPEWHWYYASKKDDIDWKPFSIKDSQKIESEYKKNPKNLTLIAVEGNRYDISIGLRKRYSVYWDSEETYIRRCLWFYKVYKHLDYSPFDEVTSQKLENEYKHCMEINRWNVKIKLSLNKGIVDICGPDEFYHYYSEAYHPTTEKNLSSFVYKPTIVRRGFKGVKLSIGESDDVDHLLFIVHGIGPGCDLKFHTIAEVVDEFRTISNQLIESHYQTSIESGLVNRIEILPISWYHELHSEYTDQKLKEITLKSMPRLRDFTNSTLLDILFYTSPIYAQKISNTVGNEMNRLYNLFRQRNKHFKGEISLGGHSLGSLIIFDILCHQKTIRNTNYITKDTDVKMPPQLRRRMSKLMGYALGVKGAGQPRISYPQLNFEPCTFFALGSPIAMFVSIRGIDFLGENFSLPTCKSFFNIFHPYDPIAYRIEPLINSSLKNINPVLIPHHKGRKRMHLEVKEMMYRLGSDVKQMIYDTWSNMTIPTLINKILNQSWNLRHRNIDENTIVSKNEGIKNEIIEKCVKDTIFGILNNGRRIDYTLQEAPIEILNEYIFAFQSHVCYWDSHDTVLLILNEIYNNMGIIRDNNDNIQEEI